MKYKMYLCSGLKSFFVRTRQIFPGARPSGPTVVLRLILCSVLFVPGAVVEVQGAGDGISVQVAKIIDGDSVEVSRRGATSTVRLYGIDTPEWKQPYSNLAKEYLQKEIAGKRVAIVPFYRDSYGRTIAIVKHEGRNLNEVLVEKGLAWVHVYYCKKTICAQWKKLERDARISEKGLWRQANPVPPWVWKREHQ
ncbi:MAG: thermonuclease family protein [Desulfopila sp.]